MTPGRKILVGAAMAMLMLTLGGPAAARHPDLLVPPDALLSLDGGPAEAGKLGSYCFFEADGTGGCGDVGEQLELDPTAFSGGEDATITIDDDSARIQRWKVTISGYPDGPETATYQSERPHPDVREIGFMAPPPGDWRVHVSLDLTTATGSGDAFYEWRLSSLPDTAMTGPAAAASTALGPVATLPLLLSAFVVGAAITRRRRMVPRG